MSTKSKEGIWDIWTGEYVKVFKTVYEIPNSKLKEDSKGKYYLEKKDLENLQECNLLYFLKESQYDVFNDFPVLGAQTKRLRYSEVKGPFKSHPEVKNLVDEFFESEVVKLIIPRDLMPVEFENVSLIEYGTDNFPDSINYVKSIAGEKIDHKQIGEIGEKVLNNLKRECQLRKSSKFFEWYEASTNDYLLEFYLSHGFSYPLITISLFGRKEETLQNLLQKTGIYELENQFPNDVRNIAIKSSVRRGLAYNLDLNQKTISDILKSDNVLI
jgi:hypothetical protein